jgi:hypothetical protein
MATGVPPRTSNDPGGPGVTSDQNAQSLLQAR